MKFTQPVVPVPCRVICSSGVIYGHAPVYTRRSAIKHEVVPKKAGRSYQKSAQFRQEMSIIMRQVWAERKARG